MRGEHLLYFRTGQAGEAPCGSISVLFGMPRPCADSKLRDKAAHFEIVTAVRTYRLQASTPQEALAWLDALRKVGFLPSSFFYSLSLSLSMCMYVNAYVRCIMCAERAFRRIKC